MKKTASSEAKQVDEIAPPAAEQQPEVKTVSVRAKLTGPKPLFCCYKTGGGRSPPCSLKFPSEILDESGLRANCEVELIATPGQVVIKKIADGSTLPAYPSATEPKKGTVLAELMRLGRQKDEEMKRRRSGGEFYEDDGVEL